MSTRIEYDDIPKHELKPLRKLVFRENTKIRLWNALIAGVACAIGVTISGATFPNKSDLIVRWVFCVALIWGLAAIFREAVVEPKIRRAVERKKQPNKSPETNALTHQ